MILVFLSHEKKKKPFSSILTCAKYMYFLEVNFICEHKNSSTYSIIPTTMVLLYDYENKIHPSEGELLKLFVSKLF